jgi:hypothetical protein
MRKASSVLGIVGGALALACAAIGIVGGVLLTAFAPDFFQNFSGFFRNDFMPGNMPSFMGFAWQAGGIVIIVVSVMMLAVGVLALMGGNLVKKNNVKAGVLMLVGGGISMFTGYGWVITVLCVLGGIFALVKEKSPDNAPPPPQG